MAAVALSEMTMEEQFDTCSEFVSKTMSVQTDWPKSTPAEKLEIYKWFKHIKDGDAPKDRPSFTSALMKTGGPIAAAELQARFDVWAACRGASKDTAMAAYVSTIIMQCSKFKKEELLLEFIQRKQSANQSPEG